MNGDAGTAYFHAVYVMRAFFAPILLIALFLLNGPAAVGQGTDRSSLMNDLCGCMSDIDLRASDRTVEFGVRDCLENAVIAHPAEVHALLQRTAATGSKAFRLGSALGANLLRVCGPFRAVKARLEQMPPKKQGT